MSRVLLEDRGTSVEVLGVVANDRPNVDGAVPLIPFCERIPLARVGSAREQAAAA